MDDQYEGLTLSEVIARVSFRLIVRDYRIRPDAYTNPNAGLIDLARRLTDDGFWVLGFWVVGAAFETRRRGVTVKEWRNGVVIRARLHASYRRRGQPWRRAYGPRVTNRGAISVGSAVRRPWGKRRARW